MQHPENIRTVLKAANLSEASDLTDDQLQRARDVADGKVKATGVGLANFILKGGKGSGKPAGRQRAKGKMSFNDAAATVLKRARGPLHAKEVFKRAVDGGLIETKGKTPEQTMASRLAVGARAGKFERTAPNTYTLPKKTAKKASRKKEVAAAKG